MGNWPFAGERERYWLPAMGNLVSGMKGVWPFNFCLSEVQCAVGRRLLRRLDAINARRRAQADVIRSALTDVPELSLPEGAGGLPARLPPAGGPLRQLPNAGGRGMT